MLSRSPGGRAIGVVRRALLLLALALFLMVDPLTAWGGSGDSPSTYISYVMVVNADVIGGPLARYGFKDLYARVLVSLDLKGTVVGTAYIIDAYPDILFTPYWRGYVEDILNKALAIVSSSIKRPPAYGGWLSVESKHSVVFVVSQGGGQEVYKCKAVGWRITIAKSHGFEWGYVRAYTDPVARYPLYVEASFTTSWYKVSLRAEAQYINGMKSPCGHPIKTSMLKEILGISVLAITVAALVAYAKRPKTPMVVIREAYWP
jgi:hypothetical protein